jgi:hypothetical protein
MAGYALFLVSLISISVLLIESLLRVGKAQAAQVLAKRK